MKKFIDSVKALGEKMAGKEIKGKNLIDVIDETAENYQGGAGSGSEIVDALPAQGSEGSTYLLRKEDDSKVFKAQAYVQLYHKNEEALPMFSMMIDPDTDLLRRVILERLNPNLSNGLVDFTGLVETLLVGVKSSEEWNTFITSNKVAIVKTEEEVLNITEDVDYIFQDLGVIGIEDLNIVESRQSNSETNLAMIMSISNNLCFSYIVQNDKVSVRYRSVVPASKSGTGKNYGFEDQQIGLEPAPYAGTLTDTYVYDQETLMSLEDGDCYLINLTPQEVSYSYTQYVFDQGVYTVVGGGSARYFVTVYGMTNAAGNYPGQITIEVDTPNINTVNDLCNWFKAKGFVTTVAPNSPSKQMIVYPNATGLDGGKTTNGYVLYENGDYKAIYSPGADIAIYSNRNYTLTYVTPEK